MHHSVLGAPRSPPRSEEPPSIGLTDTSLRHTEDYLGVYSQIPCVCLAVCTADNFNLRSFRTDHCSSARLSLLISRRAVDFPNLHRPLPSCP
ncbi:hypothetical protein TNCV_3044761 [Trichonephila clavipes]|nr:hypothetical protein TNCV_3044761 [Trichonephila clavipes]